MKLFIDTSNSRFILSLINDNNKIIDFLSIKTNNNIVKNFINWIDDFLKSNNQDIKEINEFLITIGPGSFTGVKVAFNFVKTFYLTNNSIKLKTIGTFDLLREDDKKYTAIKFGKNKFYFKKNHKYNIFSKMIILENLEKYNLKKITMDYDTFTKEKLQQKLNKNLFKLENDLNDVKIKYLSNF